MSKNSLEAKTSTSIILKVFAAAVMLLCCLFVYFNLKSEKQGLNSDLTGVKENPDIESLSKELTKVASSQAPKQQKAQEIISLIQKSRELGTETDSSSLNAEASDSIPTESSTQQ